MKTRIISKLSIFLMTAVITAGSSYGYSEAEQSIQTTVQPAVAIEKLSSSIEKSDVNAMTGVHSGLRSVFSLKTNGSDSDYDFIIYSRIKAGDSEVSGYGKDGQLLFAHTLAYPTMEAINNAKAGGNDNKNVIAYPVTATGVNLEVTNYQQNYGTHGDCYVVKVNSAQEGTVTHEVGGTPVSGSYSVTQDQAGTYQAVVYFAAVSK